MENKFFMDAFDVPLLTAAEGLPFLRGCLKASGVPSSEIIADTRCGFHYRAMNDDAHPSDLLYCEVEARSGDCTLYNLEVGSDYRGKGLGLGLAAMKAALAAAYEHGASSILIYSVRHDGPGFWAMFGARPVTAIVDLPGHILDVARERKAELDGGARRRIALALQQAKADPLAGWHALAQTSIRLGKTYFSNLVFDRICGMGNMILQLDEAQTQACLRKYLGAIPPFPLADENAMTARKAMHRGRSWPRCA